MRPTDVFRSSVRRKSLFVLCVVVLIAELLCSEDGKRKLVSKSLDEAHPKNLTHIYEGPWFLTSGDSVHGFKQDTGLMVLQLLNTHSSFRDVDIVEGNLNIRDGVYSTDHTYHYFIYGIYMNQSGKLQIYAVPLGLPIIGGSGEYDDLSYNATGALHEAFPKISKHYEEILRNQLNAPPETGCYFNITLSVNTHRGSDQDNTAENIKLSGLMNSNVCKCGLTVRLEQIVLDSFYQKAINYAIATTGTSIVQALTLLQQLEYSSTPSGASKVSMLTIGQQAIVDSYLCLIHLTVGIVFDPLFNAFSTAAFFMFVIFSIYEMRYLLFIWKARRPQIFSQGIESWRQELSFLYIRFYGFLMLGIFLFYKLQGMFYLFILLMYSFWIPQIISNVHRDSRRALLPSYIIGISATRLFIPYYFLGCPHNILEVQPDQSFLVVLTIYVFVQALVLLLQDHFGPRACIPTFLLPAKYDYHRRITIAENEHPECVICMTPVTAERNQYMVTPCDHVFHPLCLERWMAIKYECPTCRGALPEP